MESIQHLGDDLEAPERGHEVDAGVPAADLTDQPLSHLDADPQRPVAGVSEARADLLGDRDAGHLVVEELSVAVAVEREHADDHGNRRGPPPPAKTGEPGPGAPRSRPARAPPSAGRPSAQARASRR